MDIFEQKCQENLTIDQLIEIFQNEPLKFKPGSKYSYSNSNVRDSIPFSHSQNFFFSIFYWV